MCDIFVAFKTWAFYLLFYFMCVWFYVHCINSLILWLGRMFGDFLYCALSPLFLKNKTAYQTGSSHFQQGQILESTCSTSKQVMGTQPSLGILQGPWKYELSSSCMWNRICCSLSQLQTSTHKLTQGGMGYTRYRIISKVLQKKIVTVT